MKATKKRQCSSPQCSTTHLSSQYKWAFRPRRQFLSSQLELQLRLRDKPHSRTCHHRLNQTFPTFTRSQTPRDDVLIRVQRFVFLPYLLAAINPMLAPPLPPLNSSHAPASIWSSLRLLQQAGESPVFLHATRCARTRRWVLRSPRQPSALPMRRLGLPAARHKRTLARARATTPDTARRA